MILMDEKRKRLPIAHIIKWILFAVAVALVLAIVTSYLLVRSVPPQYKPAILTETQKAEAAGKFLMRVQEFGNTAGRNEPFDWTITEDEINETLASLEQIAEKVEQGRAADVHRALEKVGIHNPAVSLDDGVMTLMMHVPNMDKLVSADLAFEVTPDNKIVVRPTSTRLGRFPIPMSLARGRINQLQQALAQRHTKASSKPSFGGLSTDDLAEAMIAIIGAIDATPMPAEHVWPVTRKRFRIESIKISEGKMTLHIIPLRKKPASAPAEVRTSLGPVE